MLRTIRLGLILAVFGAWTHYAAAQEPSILVPLTITGDNVNKDPGGTPQPDTRYGFGLDAAASDGIDELDHAIPPPGFADDPNQAKLEFDVSDPATTLFRDIHNFVDTETTDSATYTFRVDYGTPADDITISWEQALFQPGGTIFENGYTTAEIRDTTGGVLQDMSTAGSFVLSGSGSTTILFVIAQDNAKPVANDDLGITIFGTAAQDIDVLANDIDADGHTINLFDDGFPRATTRGGSVNLNNGQISYTPPAGTADPSDPDTWDTFTYTIQDVPTGDPAPPAKQDTATVSVIYLSGDLIATRTVAHTFLNSGADPGVTVTINVSYNQTVIDTANRLEITEFLPAFDDFSNSYAIPAGVGVDNFEVFGEIHDVQHGLSSVVFTFDLTGNDLPADGDFEFTYHIEGGTTDVLSKEISGEVLYELNTVQTTVPVSPDPSDTLPVNSFITLSNDTGTTTEDDGTVQLSVTLPSQPDSDVTLTLVSNDTLEGQVTVPGSGTLTFTPENFNVAQNVVVTGVDDDIDDGDIAYTVTLTATSTDPVYNGATDDINLDNTDNDVAGVTLNVTDAQTAESGDTGSFTVVLDSEPIADVIIDLASTVTTEGQVTDPVGRQLTFTSLNWDTAQTVTVTGQDESIDDGDQDYDITLTVTSTDQVYDGFATGPVGMNNTDDDTAGVNVNPATVLTSEDGTTAQILVTLSSEPVGATTVDVAVATGMTEAQVDTNMLNFDDNNWDTGLTVTVTGLDDDVADGHQAFTIDFDFDYSGVNGTETVNGNNADNEIAGISVMPGGGITTNEGGASDQIDVRLNSEPTADVTVDIGGLDATEGELNVNQLTFTNSAGANPWNVVQSVTVTGIDDTEGADEADGEVTYLLDFTLSSTDATYGGNFATSVRVTNEDQDDAGNTLNVTFSPNSLSFGEVETDESKTFYITLASAEAGEVTYTVASSNAVFTVEPTSVAVPAGGTSSVAVTYTPTAQAVDTGAITLMSGGDTITVNVTGIGIDAAADGMVSIRNCVVVARPSGTEFDFAVELDSQTSFDQFTVKLDYPSAVINITSITSPLAADQVVINNANGTITFQYVDVSTTNPLFAGTLFQVEGTLADTTTSTYPLALHSLSTDPTGDIQIKAGQFVVSEDVVIGNLDVEESGVSDFTDLILLFRYLFVVIDLDGNGEKEGDELTFVGAPLIPTNLQGTVTLPPGDIKTNIDNVLPLADVDNSGATDFTDLILIFRYQFVVIDLDGNGEKEGDELTFVGAPLIPTNLQGSVMATEDEIKANIDNIIVTAP